MMPILVESDDVRSGGKAKARHGRLRAAQESMGYDWSLGNSEFCFPRISLFPETNSGNKIHCFPRDQSLSVNYFQYITYSEHSYCTHVTLKVRDGSAVNFDNVMTGSIINKRTDA